MYWISNLIGVSFSLVWNCIAIFQYWLLSMVSAVDLYGNHINIIYAVIIIMCDLCPLRIATTRQLWPSSVAKETSTTSSSNSLTTFLCPFFAASSSGVFYICIIRTNICICNHLRNCYITLHSFTFRLYLSIQPLGDAPTLSKYATMWSFPACAALANTVPSVLLLQFRITRS